MPQDSGHLLAWNARWRQSPSQAPASARETKGSAPHSGRDNCYYLRGAESPQTPRRLNRRGQRQAEKTTWCRGLQFKIPAVNWQLRGSRRGGGGWGVSRSNLSRVHFLIQNTGIRILSQRAAQGLNDRTEKARPAQHVACSTHVIDFEESARRAQGGARVEASRCKPPGRRLRSQGPRREPAGWEPAVPGNAKGSRIFSR